MSAAPPKLKTTLKGSRLTIDLTNRCCLVIEDAFTTLLELQDHLNGMFPSEQRQWVRDYVAEKMLP